MTRRNKARTKRRDGPAVPGMKIHATIAGEKDIGRMNAEMAIGRINVTDAEKVDIYKKIAQIHAQLHAQEAEVDAGTIDTEITRDTEETAARVARTHVLTLVHALAPVPHLAAEATASEETNAFGLFTYI
eukprot:TRINITY_DN2187_c0_g1_i3.p2 TRINITY_DN2187_c0_g1~~TRINITY_DN2187_c0_g1_i3.p2  ORF type:complete len:130 (-),score=7.21 TRINITY_DN2187_c0_g1_i3:83-472(-)